MKLGKKVPYQEPEKCVSCNGSGYYDVWGSPECSACNGTGAEDTMN